MYSAVRDDKKTTTTGGAAVRRSGHYSLYDNTTLYLFQPRPQFHRVPLHLPPTWLFLHEALDDGRGELGRGRGACKTSRERSRRTVNGERHDGDVPPISAVRTLPALMTSNVARPMLFAMWSRLGTTKGSDAERARSRGALPEMPEHHRGGEDHGGGVGAVGAHDVLRDVTTTRLEERIFLHRKYQRRRRV